MPEISSRHRPFSLLAGILLAQVFLLAFQIKTGRDVRLIRVWAVELLTPMQRGGTWTVATLRGGWRNYVDLRHARAENERLRSDLDRLQLRNYDLESQALEQQRVARLADFRQAHADVPMLSARVVGANADSASHTVYINRGSSDGIRRDMGVIVPEGVVGKILAVYSGTAQVLLINDKESGVGALLATSRTHGVARGLEGQALRLDYVINDENIPPGERVVTSGDDQIFPKDLPIGHMVSAQPGNPFKLIRIEAAARLDRLEDVIVLLSQQDLFPPQPGTLPAAASSTSSLPALPPATRESQKASKSKPAAAPGSKNPPPSSSTSSSSGNAPPRKPIAAGAATSQTPRATAPKPAAPSTQRGSSQSRSAGSPNPPR